MNLFWLIILSVAVGVIIGWLIAWRNKDLFAFLGVLVTASVSLGGSPFKPADAHLLAAEDMVRLEPEAHRYLRYVWVSSGTAEDVKACSFTLNWLSSTLPYRPPVVGDGKTTPMLVRVDLRKFCLTEGDLKRWTKTWEEFTFDHSFSLLFTHDSLKLLLDAGWEKPKWLLRLIPSTKQIAVASAPYKAADGKQYAEKWVNVFRLPHEALDHGTLAFLEKATNSTAPVVELDYFVMRALASIQDDGVYKTIFGGLYYEFAGVRTAASAGKKKATDLDQLFEDLGIIDDADGATKAQAKLDRMGSEQRVAMLHSNVTGKLRAVYILPTLKSVRERGVLFLTQDVKDSSIDVLDNVFLNLLDFKPDAMEAIWVDGNGSQKYALFNKAGALQREVPPDVANDSTIPSPYTQRLQTVGCITCHGRGGNDGWQPLKNDAAAVLPNLLADVSNKKFNQESVNRITQLYQGDADVLLRDLRRGTIGTVMRMTGPWEASKDQLDVYKLTAAQVTKIRDRFWYTPITAAEMLRSLGHDPGKDTAEAFLEKYLIGGEIEDVRLLQLMQGKALPRAQAALIQGFLAGRLQANIALNRKEKP